MCVCVCVCVDGGSKHKELIEFLVNKVQLRLVTEFGGRVHSVLPTKMSAFVRLVLYECFYTSSCISVEEPQTPLCALALLWSNA